MEDTAQSEVLAKKELLPPLNWVPRALAGLAKAELGKAPPPPAPASCLRWGGGTAEGRHWEEKDHRGIAWG